MKFKKIENKTIDETLFYATHRSGLDIYFIPKKFKKSYASFATKYGSIDSAFVAKNERTESVVPDGIAHFLEHKLFEKPDGGNAFDDYAKTGGSANAYTSFDLTAYLFSSTDRFYDNLEILFDTVTKPYFTDENVEKEQGIIAQEIRMYDDNADWRVFFNLLEALYINHPVRRDIAGTVESIAKIDKNLLMKCYNTFYHPSNMALFLAGDLDIERVSEMVDSHIEGSASRTEIRRVYPFEPSGVAVDFTEQKLSVAAPIFLMGYKDDDAGVDGPELLKKDAMTQILLEMLFGRSGSLYRDLYEKGLINNTFSKDFTAEKGYSYSTFGGESRDPIAVRDAILKSVENFRVTNEAFDRARGVITGRFYRIFNGIERMGNNFIANIFKNINIFEFPETCASITLDELSNRFFKHFREENMALSVIRPY